MGYRLGNGIKQYAATEIKTLNPVVQAQIDQALSQSAGPGFKPRPDFLYFDHKTQRELDNIPPVQTKFGLQRALPAGERNRLVRAAKSRTRLVASKIPEEKKPDNREWVADSRTGEMTFAELQEAGEPVHQREIKGSGKFTVIDYREWSQEWRVRTRVDAPAEQPVVNTGNRETTMLTHRAARKIADSCHYMALHKGGYTTFVTGTFDENSRAAIKTGETTIQREVTRTMDALKKMYMRGWQMKSGKKIAPAGSEFCYCWVVEIPKNEDGEDNPHIHMMMNWRVERGQFDDWAERLEGLWGHGYFKLEKIKDPLCAGAYMAKAAGYLTKAEGQDDQGLVKGNRYGISKPARAPLWCCMGEYELGVMGRLISDVFDGLTARHGEDFAERKRLNAELDKAEKGSKARHAIGKQLQKVRKKLNALPVIASKYQLTIKSEAAFTRFIGWAQSHGWSESEKPDSIWFAEFKNRMRRRKEYRRRKAMRISEYEWIRAVKYYSNWIPSELESVPWLEYEAIVA